DLGIDYARSLSFSRHTTLSVSTGSTLVSPVSTSGGGGALRFVFIGSGQLVHELGRSWSAELGVERTVRFVEELSDPILRSGVYGGLSGHLTPRLNVSAVARAASATNAARSGSRQYGSYAASGQARFALTRMLSVFTQYIYYHYSLDTGAV